MGPLDHNGFSVGLMDSMLKRANWLTYCPTRQQSPTQATQRQENKQRTGKHLLKLSSRQFNWLSDLQITTSSDEGPRHRLIYWWYWAAKEKADGNELTINMNSRREYTTTAECTSVLVILMFTIALMDRIEPFYFTFSLWFKRVLYTRLFSSVKG